MTGMSGIAKIKRLRHIFMVSRSLSLSGVQIGVQIEMVRGTNRMVDTV